VRKPRGKARKLVVPIALTVVLSATTVTAVTTALSVMTNAGCGGDDGPHVDAAIDTPII
jgi:hypothetical protein